jgi:hypothetical protein
MSLPKKPRGDAAPGAQAPHGQDAPVSPTGAARRAKVGTVDSERPATTRGHTPAKLFAVVWKTLVDVIGTPATATLVRRSAQRALSREAELADLVISRNGFDYAYTVPRTWKAARPESLDALRALNEELSALLWELTGPVVIRRLNAIPELRLCGAPFEAPR